MKRTMLALGILLVMALVVASCGSDSTATTTTGGTTATTGAACATVDKLNIGFFAPPPDFIQVLAPLAADLGFFTDQCLDVETTIVESGGASFTAMVAGEIDLSYSGSVSPILGFAEGADAVIVTSSGALLDFVVIAIPEIDSCEALRGRRVATDGPGALQHAIMEAYLGSCGLDIDTDVELVIATGETYEAQFAQGNIDATDLHIDEALSLSQNLGVEFNILGESWKFAPSFHYASWTTSSTVLAEKRPAIVRFTAALLQAGAWIQDPANKEDAAARVIEITQQTPGIILQAFEDFGTNFPATCAQQLPLAAYEGLMDFQITAGNLDETYPVTDLVDLSVCRDAEILLGRQPTNPPPG